MSAALKILPIGSWEYHGPHLPMDTDTRIASGVAQRIKNALFVDDAPVRGLAVELLPAISISCSHEHSNSVSIRASTLLHILEDIQSNFDGPLVVINAHGGNHVLEHWALEQNRRKVRSLWFPRSWNWRIACERAGVLTPWGEDVHAGEIETSIMLEIAPQDVFMERCPDDRIAPAQRMWPVLGMSQFSRDGVIGAPSRATAQTGRKLLDALVDLAIEEIVVVAADWRSVAARDPAAA